MAHSISLFFFSFSVYPLLYICLILQVLDFDFEKFCSVSLTNLNVYACLVCGKYFQGRGPKSHAYTHSLEAGHHVYINLRTEKVYCLPDGYEVIDPSLDDIIHVLNPRFGTTYSGLPPFICSPCFV